MLRLKADIGAELEGEIEPDPSRARAARSQLRQIQEELGEQDDNAEVDESSRKKIEDSKMTDEVRAVAKKQLSRMSQMASSSPEYTTSRGPTSRICSRSRGTCSPRIASTA